jgi:amidase
MRRLLAVLALSLVFVPTAGAADCARTVGGVDLQTATLPQLEQAMADGRLTSVQLVDAYLARIAAYPQLNAIRDLAASARSQAAALDAERAAGHVRGPLHGIPVLLKDNVGTSDEPTTAGSIALAGVVPKDDAVVTQRLRDAGAVVLGKTNLSEFAGWVDLSMPPGYSSLGGQVVNAYTGGDPSGSSAGSGVAASMAMAGATIGTETSGSILSPTSINGDVGIKPTLGLVSTKGILPLAPDFDVPGPIVRTVTDAALVLGAIAGRDYTGSLHPGALKGVRLAYPDGDVDSAHSALFDAAIAQLEKLGATVVPTRSLSDTENYGLTEIGAIPNEFKASLNAYLHDEMPNARVHTLGDIVAYNEQHPDKVKYGQGLLQASDATPGREELFAPQAEPSRAGARASIDAALAETGADAIITPGPAQANIGAAAGYPTVMVPLGYASGEPFGLGFLAGADTEAKLIAYAYDYEQASHARVVPNDLNAKLTAAGCAEPAGASAAAAPSAGSKPLPALRLRALRRRGHGLALTVTGMIARRVQVVVRRGARVVARRTVARNARGRAGARARLRLGRRATYTITVLDPGPPPRTARLRARA